MSLDPFTLDLFGNTALSGFGLSAFPVDGGGDAGFEEDDHSQTRHLPEDTPCKPVLAPVDEGYNFSLNGNRDLAKSWKDRARDNLTAIKLAALIETEKRPATSEEQAKLIRFTGFGASELANACFRGPGETDFRKGWQEIGSELESAVAAADYASLARCTQYAHFTPEFIVRAMWKGLSLLGFRGGRVLEPGIGTGLFPALMPEGLREAAHVTGVELDPVTARIARLLQPRADIINGDFAKADVLQHFDLAIGNPPFSDRIVRSDPAFRKLGLRLHDYFIVKAIDRLKPGGLAAFVTSYGTMDKADARACQHILSMADLVGAVRLPEGSFREDAGTDVGVDILFFRKRCADETPRNKISLDTVEVAAATEDRVAIKVNRYFSYHPEMVLGTHDLSGGRFGDGDTYVCRPKEGAVLEDELRFALTNLPEGIYDGEPEVIDEAFTKKASTAFAAMVAAGSTIREGSYFVGKGSALMQIVDGQPQAVAIKSALSKDGIFAKQALIIRKLIPIRDAVREILRSQETDQPYVPAQVRLRIAWSSFVREFGPINFTSVSTTTDEETGEVRETHRRPNLAPFLDDPDCWLVASIEDYDLETNTAKPGPIFSERVISPPAPPIITSALDALAVVLNERGHVDPDHVAELLHADTESVIAELGSAIFRDPSNGAWQTADSYLSGAVRTKLKLAEAAAALDPVFARNVEALREVQPVDLKPSDITARLGAPWIPAAEIVAFVTEAMDTSIVIHHTPELACWTLEAGQLEWLASGTSEWGTHRRHAGLLLSDALNSSIPQIFDTVRDGVTERRILNSEATEAAKEKLAKIKTAFQAWIWTDPDRTDRLARLYNDRFNNLVPRHFDGNHLQLPGASGAFSLYGHQKRVIWRIIASGSTYMAHAVGAGKTLSIAAAIMEQRRLGLINKAMLVVPGHCLAQAAREFLALYPNARILVADETNFVKDKRHRFLSRAATANWDAIIITHSAFKFIPVPAAFEREMIAGELQAYEDLLLKVDREDRLSRKRIERMKEGHAARLEALTSRKDDLLTISELGIDQIIVDEAQEFRKLSFATNMTSLRGVDPNGSQRAWDLFVKSRFLEIKNPGRSLILASGTPITNTLGEMFTVQRLMDNEALHERGLHEFDAWASTFGDTSTELELQPSGKYRPVTRFAEFVNVPELIAMFRSFADVVQPSDLRQYVKVPSILGGKRQIITAESTPAFKAYQQTLDQRIKAIEEREGAPKPGDDILLSVITDGRHAAIDLRLVADGHHNEPRNKLNLMIGNVFRIWRETSEQVFYRKDGKPFDRAGAGQMIFSDLGTIAVEATRGFSAYRWIRSELIRLGIPPSEIAFMQDSKKSEAKQRLFNEFNSGKVRILIGSSETMGTGVNVQTRLAALHHLDVPWLPSQIEQREGRIVRQGNQHEEVGLYAYATLGSLDATMWQNNERKARFIGAALSGDTSVRRLEDLGSGQANQFAMAKAIASGDPRLMQKAGLEAEIARLGRLHAAHVDDQHACRRQIRDATNDIELSMRRIEDIGKDIERLVPTQGDAFRMSVNGQNFDERKPTGRALMTEILTLVQLGQEEAQTIASIGGFDLEFQGKRVARDGFQYTTMLKRTGARYEVDLSMTVTPLGAISRLEHALSNFENERQEYRRRLIEGEKRLAAYQPRLGETFVFEGELELKRAELAEIETSLAASSDKPGNANVNIIEEGGELIAA
jgi:N12 class adenine-specific DNA methylase/adenine-specific DNA methylase